MEKEITIGAALVLGGLVFVGALQGLDGLKFVALLFLMSLLSVYLWGMRVSTGKMFYLVKIPLNIALNAFLLLLVLKWWTERPYIRRLKQLESET